MARAAWLRLTTSAAAFLTAVTLVAAVGFGVASGTGTAAANLAFGLVVAPLAAGLGVFITRRTGDNPVGALLAFVGLTVALVVVRETAWQLLAQRSDAQDWAWLVASVEEAAWWVLVAVALLLLHFPDGRLPGRRWRWVPAVLVMCTVVNQLYGALDQVAIRAPLDELDRPFIEPPLWLELIGTVAFVLMLGLVLASAASLVIRYRRADSLQRRQLRWLVVGGLGLAAYPLLCLVEIAIWGEPLWLSAAFGLAGLAGIPVTTAVAMLRHDLYDVDRTIAGTVTWGLVTATLLALYALASVTAGLVLGRDSALAAAGVTAVGAVALAPLKHRLQRQVDRRIYPLRRAAYEAIDQLHAEVSVGRALPEDLEATLQVALRDPDLKVIEGELETTSEELAPELLHQVAERARTLVEMARLRGELAGALHEVEASRARLVQIGYDERRRLERDLHDGAQQRLVSLGMAIRLAQRHLDDGTVNVDELLDECVAELGTAVAELRQLAHGIRPSSLDDGLPAAVARLVRGVPLTVDLQVDDSALPDDVATTAYFVISESLANAVKHAQASRIGLQVSRLNGQVVVRVTDDGRGGAKLAPESGLADRVAALGGSLTVASPAGGGTVVEAELPCVS